MAPNPAGPAGPFPLPPGNERPGQPGQEADPWRAAAAAAGRTATPGYPGQGPAAADPRLRANPAYAASTQYMPRLEGEPPSPGGPPAFAAAPYAAAGPPPGYHPGGNAGPAPARPSEFADEATEVYGEEGSADQHQVKGRLAVLEGELAGHWFTLLGADIRVGRSDDNHLIIPDLAVSRHHVRLVYGQGAYRLQDLRSGNGCFVNGIPVDEATLRDGDQIEVGRTVMEFLTVDRPPGPVRFRRSQLPGAPGQPAFPTATPRAQLPPAGYPAPPQPPPPMAPSRPSQPAAMPQPLAMAQQQPQPLAMAQQQSQPLARPQQQPQPLAMPQQVPQPLAMPQQMPQPLAMPQQVPQPRRAPQDFPRTATPSPLRDGTPVNVRPGMPGWAIVTFVVLGLAILGLVSVVAYKLAGPRLAQSSFISGLFGPPEPTPFEQAQEAYKAGHWDEALARFKAVPADDEKAADAQRSIQLISENKKKFEEGRGLRAEADLAGAVARLREIPESQPYASEAADLIGEIEEEIRVAEEARPKGPVLTPGSPLDRALEPYRKERLAQTVTALTKLTADPEAQRLAPLADQLMKELRLGKQLLQQKKYDEARPHLEGSLTLDIQLGGALKAKILPLLTDTLLVQLDAALEARKYEEAGTALQALRAAAPDHPRTEPLTRQLAAQAKDMLVEAVQLKELTPMKAKRLLKAILQMVPPSDPTYVRAKEELAKPASSER